jgi:hypothetical protein
VWGFHKDKDKNNNTWNELYDKKMIKKKKLYDENNIELIEIFSKDFDNLSYEQINKNLLNIFKEYRNEHFECVDLNIYVDARKNTNDELFNICMELSTIDNVIPPSTTFRDMNLRCIYEEIIKRFGNIKNFAKEYNVKTTNEYRSEQKLLRKKNKAI